MKPESLMMSYGYDPQRSEGAIKCPIFQTSTFVFKNAEEGKAFFEVAYGKREKEPTESMGLIYSRLNNPDLEILEDRLCLWDGAEDAAVFESGMSAISTVMMEFLKPGDILLYSSPTYGGTHHFINNILSKFNVTGVPFYADESKEEVLKKLESCGGIHQLGMVYVETPANPTLALFDIELCKEIASLALQVRETVPVVVDNTLMGPLWSQPLQLGADIVLYSATKYIGGHSDLIAGAVLGSTELMGRIKGMRTFLGNMAGPWTGWLLMRSLETLKVRMEQQEQNAQAVADYLRSHPIVEQVHYLGHIEEGHPSYQLYKKQYTSGGAMLAFEVMGGEAEAFQFLNQLKLVKLAVSLGSTESLAEHPATMTHADVADEDKARLGITEQLVRLSIGVENVNDLIADLEQALGSIQSTSLQTKEEEVLAV